MVEFELKELIRIMDRKADKSQIAKYVASYRSKTLTHARTNGEAPQLGYRFGQDLNVDFTTLFAAFNRVAKQKLDATVLADFASVQFTDHLYRSKSTQFSAQLTESCALYYRLFDEKVEKMHKQIAEFRQLVNTRQPIITPVLAVKRVVKPMNTERLQTILIAITYRTTMQRAVARVRRREFVPSVKIKIRLSTLERNFPILIQKNGAMMQTITGMRQLVSMQTRERILQSTNGTKAL